MTRLLTALAGSLAFGAVGLAEDLARMRSPAALGLRRDVRLLLEALAAAFVLLLLQAAGCLPRGLDVPGAGYVLLGSAVLLYLLNTKGNVTVNVLPRPSTLWAVSEPPSKVTNCCEIANPKPLAPWLS